MWLNDEKHIHSLFSTDDNEILTENEEGVNYMLRKLIEKLDLWGLEKNLVKTKYMVIGAVGHNLLADEGTIALLKEYRYL